VEKKNKRFPRRTTCDGGKNLIIGIPRGGKRGTNQPSPKLTMNAFHLVSNRENKGRKYSDNCPHILGLHIKKKSDIATIDCRTASPQKGGEKKKGSVT